MIIEKVDAQRSVENNWALNGNVLTVCGLTLDLEEEQQDSQARISIMCRNGEVCRGVSEGGEYIAEVVIPPRRYQLSEPEGEEAIVEPLPLDVDTVILRLWPIKPETKTNEEVA